MSKEWEEVVDGTKLEVDCIQWTSNSTILLTFLDKQMIPTSDQISTIKLMIKIMLYFNN